MKISSIINLKPNLTLVPHFTNAFNSFIIASIMLSVLSHQSLYKYIDFIDGGTTNTNIENNFLYILAMQDNQSVYSSSSLIKHDIPKQFKWPRKDSVDDYGELKEPVVDLEGFLTGDQEATQHAANLIRAACFNHGFFQVINHGVDYHLIENAHEHMNFFFRLPYHEKQRIQKRPGSICGFSGPHADRFLAELPWKETLTFRFNEEGIGPAVVDFFKSNLGEGFEMTGLVFQSYCEAMKKLSLQIMEILGIALGVNQSYYKDFFHDSNSIMRCNFYPCCQEPGLTFGTGPHCDPTSLTILHQDGVGGLEVFANNKWSPVRPRHDALVIQIGDTFTALSNGEFKSCLHRAVVNRYQERMSLVFFVCPREDKLVKPPEDLVERKGLRKYPNFRWSDFLDFTQKHYRVDGATLQNFTKWLVSGKRN